MTLVVEVGVSHTGIGGKYPFKKSIDAAVDSGALLLKGQLYEERHLPGNPFYEQVKKAMLTGAQARELMDYAHERGAELFWTPEDETMMPLCERLGVKYYKVSHAQSQNQKLLDAIGLTGKPAIVSTLDTDRAAFSPPKLLENLWHIFYCYGDYRGRTGLRTLRQMMHSGHGKLFFEGCSLHDIREWVNLMGWHMFGSAEVHFALGSKLVDAPVSIGFPCCREQALADLVWRAKEAGIDQPLAGFGRSIE